MAVVLNTNLKINKAVPVDTRNYFKKLADMRNYNSSLIDLKHIAYCEETDKRYEFIGPGTAQNPNEFRGDDKTGTGYWRELVINVDIDIDAISREVANLRESVENLGNMEVIQVPSLPSPSKNTTNTLYLVPVEGEDTFNEHITTKSRKTATDAVLEVAQGANAALELNGKHLNELNIQAYVGDWSKVAEIGRQVNNGWGEGDIIITGELEANLFGVYVATADAPIDSEWQLVYEAHEGDRFYTKDGKCYVVNSAENDAVRDEDPYNYAWLTIGQTSYDMSSKQDALEFNGSIIKAYIEVDGHKIPFMLQGEQLINPALPSITNKVTTEATGQTYTDPGTDEVKTMVEQVSFKVNPTTNGSTLYYNINRSGTPVLPALSDSNFNASKTFNIKCTADNAANVYKQNFAFSVSANKLGLWSVKTEDNEEVQSSAVVEGVVHYKLKLNEAVADGNTTSSTRNVTLSVLPASVKDGNVIRYAINGHVANDSPVYSEPVPISSSSTIYYKAFNSNCIDSDEGSLYVEVGAKAVKYGVILKSKIEDVTLSDITGLNDAKINNVIQYNSLPSTYSVKVTDSIEAESALAVLAIPGTVNNFKAVTDLGDMTEGEDFDYETKHGYRILYVPFKVQANITFKSK